MLKDLLQEGKELLSPYDENVEPLDEVKKPGASRAAIQAARKVAGRANRDMKSRINRKVKPPKKKPFKLKLAPGAYVKSIQQERNRKHREEKDRKREQEADREIRLHSALGDEL